MNSLLSILVLVALLVSTPIPTEPDAFTTDSGVFEYGGYMLGTAGEYARDGRLCRRYWAQADRDATEDELKQIFNTITNGDGYFLHQVWFVDDARFLDGLCGGFACVEETTDNGFIYTDNSDIYDQIKSAYDKK